MENFNKLNLRDGDIITEDKLAIIDSNTDKYNANKTEILNTIGTEEMGTTATTIKGAVNELGSQLNDMATIYVSDYILLVKNLGQENEDWSDAIIQAINNIDKGRIIFPSDKIIQITKQIQLKKGIIYDFNHSIGYYNGMKYYADSDNIGDTPRIKAITPIEGGMFSYINDGTDIHKGLWINNCLFDCNKLAEHGFEIVGDQTSLKEDKIILNNVGVQGATSDGIIGSYSLANVFSNINVSACNGLGIKLIGFSDSILINPYIHTNDGGGLYVGSSSGENQAIGGKIEDNYSNGIESYGSSLKVTSTIFHSNNGYDLYAHDGASIAANGIKCSNSNLSATSGSRKTTYCINGSTIKLVGCDISGADYVGGANASNCIYKLISNDITINEDVLLNSSTYTVKKRGNIVNGETEFINSGAKFKKIDIEPSTTGILTFTNAIKLTEKFPNNYFKMGAYFLTVQTAKYPGNNDVAKTGVYLVSIGQSNTSLGITITPVQSPADTTWIGSVTGTISNNDILINITAGANVGETSGHKTFYVSLMDMGINGYNAN